MYHMRQVSIRELHQTTGKIVRSAREKSFLITFRGLPVAVLGPLEEGERGKPLPDREEEILALPRTDTSKILEDVRGRF